LDEPINTTIPHYSLGSSECAGRLNSVVTGDHADIFCSECGVVVRTVKAIELREILSEMELQVESASAECPHCGTIHLAHGASKVLQFVCGECGQTVAIKTDEHSRPVSVTRFDPSDKVLGRKGATPVLPEVLGMAAPSPAPQPAPTKPFKNLVDRPSGDTRL
jgi:ribosomal protein S27AE